VQKQIDEQADIYEFLFRYLTGATVGETVAVDSEHLR